MKHVKQILSALLLLLSLSLAFVACKKDPVDPDPQPAVTAITSIDPATAPVGSTIAISGTNFSTDPASNTITIGGVTATVVSASPTKLVIVVPAGAANGPVSVTANGQTAQSAGTFTVAIPGLKPTKEVRGTTFANMTWKKDTIYVLRGQVYIPADYKLTIEPGTIIKGTGPEMDPNGTKYPGALIVERRAQLIAIGTPTQPIVFTSSKAVGQRGYGDWGGVVLIGKSPVNQSRTAAYPNGIRGTVEAYGEPFDNSGTLQYVRIEYAGATQPTTPASRLGGLTLIGVGTNTVIDHVQVSYSGSDAFAWFGGTAKLKNLFAYRSFDDDWSADWGYVGNVQFGVALRDVSTGDPSGSNSFEVDNFQSAETSDVTAVTAINGYTQTAPTFANFSSFAYSTSPTTGLYNAGIYLRRNTAVSIYNSLVYGFPVGVYLEGAAVGPQANITSGTLDLKGVVIANSLTPVVGAGSNTPEQATAYFTGAGRSNQIVATSDIATLLLNSNNLTLSSPAFVLQTGSPLLTGAVTGNKLTDPFFTPVTYRGAFGTENWVSGWTNVNPQATDYDR
ncbi:IPT/TIG domain-containing protein [Spirosoma sp.]|uniref:IPT/TIG domain-containing protein n=1 Tax=Spirosoma sp. TaxID=1899569 RepID=UPI0026275D46|nr:IPT/TIG domain-containing protein [Spirosoma sp.]MCX6219282.1 IPT/TIG domain-containing protein [Spirosoma sp.]